MNAPLPLHLTGSAVAEDVFRWPAPPYFEFARESDRIDWADCLMTFREGTSANGRISGFDPGEARLTFLQDGAGETISVAFSDLLKLQLGRPVALRRESPLPAATESKSLRQSESQPFRIELASGEIFQGVTLGYVSALCGLFLYLPQENGNVVRGFVPAQAAKTCSFDAAIAPVLVDQNAAAPDAAGTVLNLQSMTRTQRRGRYLAQNKFVSPDQLAAALELGRDRASPRPGDASMEPGRVSTPELDFELGSEALEHTAPIMQILPRTIGNIDGQATDAAMANMQGVPALGLKANGVGAPLRIVERRKSNRLAPQAVELPARNEIGVQELVSRLAAESGNQDIAEQQAANSDSALVKLVNRIILDAVEQKASDIHIEANLGPKTTRVRFRKDGVLMNYLDLPAQFRNAVVSRIKIMSQLDITERRKPQDGKIDFSRFGPAQVELRIATVPTTGGLEDVVMRVLAASSPVPLAELGLGREMLESVKRLISKPHGLFLVCGPTGSGKTTTLHSVLAYLNTFERKIWTAEDPIEITQAGLRQVQVNAKIGWTFAAAMRSFMRADPDVIMVGEMRDAETAKIGIEASLTGHLLLSTLHTNSGPESIVRLLDLGMDPFNFADALLGVLAQRLAKRLCPECKTGYAPTSAELEQLCLEYCSDTPIDAGKQMQAWVGRYGGTQRKIKLVRAQGCEHCDHTGYLGRIGLHELLVADPATKRLVHARAPVAEVKSAAMTAGMRTLRQDGIEKVLQGLTDIRQVNAVCS